MWLGASRAGRRSRGSLPPPPPRPRPRPPRARRARSAPSIAIRWSPWASNVPPPRIREGTPRTVKPSGVARMWAPSFRRPSTTASIRSVSFARSSAAPRSMLSPCACTASRAKSGSSSTSSGTSAAPIVAPTSSDGPHVEVAGRLTADPPPVEDGDVRAHPLEHVEQAGAARIQVDAVKRQLGAGEERAGDDERRRRREVAGDLDLAELEPLHGLNRDAPRLARDGTPACASRFSVWSRVGSGSSTVVARPRRRGPRAARPTSPARSRPGART